MTLPELAGVILMALGLAVVILGFVGLCLAVYFVVAADRQDAHWPDGLDEDPTLQVQNGIGDSRPTQYVSAWSELPTADEVWAAVESDPEWSEEIRRGLQDVREGRVSRWVDVRRRA